MLNKDIKIIGCKKCVALSAIIALVAAAVSVLFVGNLQVGEGFLVKGIVALVTACVFSLLWFGWQLRAMGGFSPAVCVTFVSLVNVLVALAVSATMGEATLAGAFVAFVLSVVMCSAFFARLAENAKQYKTMENDELASKSVNQAKGAMIMVTALVVLPMTVLGVICTVMGTASLIGFVVSAVVSAFVCLFTCLDVAPNLWVVLCQKKVK